MFDVHEINDLESLAEHRDTWHALLEETPGATFFSTFEWLETYWRHFGSGQRLRVLLVESCKKPIGFLPLVVRSERRRIGTVRILTYPLDDWGSFYGPIGPRGADVLREGLRHIRATSRDWDLIELRWIDEQGDDTGQTQAAMREAGLGTYRRVRAHTAVIRMEGSWQDYLASRTSKWRNNLRRWERNVGVHGEVTFERYRPRGTAHGEDDPRWDLYDTCEEIARRSWQGSSESGTTLSHESVRSFLRDMHRVAASLGAADVNLLRLNGQAVAFAYNYVFHGIVYGLRIGFDAELSRQGAGNLMYVSAIRDSFERGDRLYDLGPGSLPAKRHLWTDLLDVVQYTHYHSLGLKALALRLKQVTAPWFTPTTNTSDLGIN